MRIRRARRADAAALTVIAHDAKQYWGYPKRWMRLWESDLTVEPEYVSHHAVYCAIRDDQVVGFYALSGAGDTRELDHLWIAPSHIGRGIGSLLFAHLLRRLRASGATQLRIASDPHAEGFYRRMGARRIGRVSSSPAGRSLPRLAVHICQT